MQADLAWLGLAWDAVERQSDRVEAHAGALDQLADAGLLYPCECSRREIAAMGIRAPDGGWRYPNRCRERAPGYDSENRFFSEDFEELKKAGYTKINVPKESGGLGP